MPLAAAHQVTAWHQKKISMKSEKKDMLRLRYNRRPWGIPILLFGNSAHDWSALCTMSGLLVGDQIWGMTIHGRNEMERKWAYIRKVYEKNQYRHAEFLPSMKQRLT